MLKRRLKAKGNKGAMLHSAANATGGRQCIKGMETSMAEQTAAEDELATMIVECLNLETVTPAQIDPEAPLFGGELGLDSIDALEIALAVSKRYGFQLRSDNPDNKQIFTNLRSLTAHVEQHRAA
jgi:acyl carrier protein